MMGDSGKPFACTEVGCNQRFVNEDHLEVHRRKHEMSLGLRDFKSLDTPVIADQTPTPTRFLKNCEEVGLFNEPHNPFDAMFRKASEHVGPDSIESSSSKNEQDSSLEVSETVVEIDDTPESVMEDSSQQAVSSTTAEDTQQMEETIVVERMTEDDLVADEVEVSSPVSHTALPILQRAPVTVERSLPHRYLNSVKSQIISITQSTLPIATPILLRLPNGQTIPVVPPSVANPSAPVPVAMSAVQQVSVVITKPADTAPLDSTSVKQKLKNTLLTCQSQGNMGVMTQAVDVVTRQQSVTAYEVSGGMSPSSPNSQIKRKRRSSDMSQDEKRERFLERNRAAATRCRNKRKVWINSLEHRADELNATNNVLSSEVTKLREEVAQLKQLLLAHNDCPVTIMQRQTHSGNILAVSHTPSSSGDGPQSPASLQHQAESVSKEDVRQLPR